MNHPNDNRRVIITLNNGEVMEASYENGCYWTIDPEDPDGSEAEVPDTSVASWKEVE